MKLYLPTLENYVNFVDELPLLLLAEVVSSSNIDHLLEVSHAIESYGTSRTTRDRQITSTKELSLLVSWVKKTYPPPKVMPSELLQKTISKARPRKGQCKES